MTKANGRILGSAIALSLMMGATGTARAGLNPQGLNPQGLNPQGLNPQGLNPQGLNPQGISLSGVTLSGIGSVNGDAFTNTQIVGSQLITFKNGVQMSGTALIGTTFQGLMHYEGDGKSASQQVTLYIADVKTDTASNTMVCDPSNPTAVPPTCTKNYHLNNDVYLYKIYYWVGDLANAPTIAPVCRGDQQAMLLKGTWAADHHWEADPNNSKVTIACTDGVIAKCARSWGYKPWRSMTNKFGYTMSMRDYHQACLRAASADYSGTGYPLTVTGTVIDMIDNGGFNVPAGQNEKFESWFTLDGAAGSAQRDYWGEWISQPRQGNIALWTELYDNYPAEASIWVGKSPKVGLWDSYTPNAMIPHMDNRYYDPGSPAPRYGAEVLVFNPIWSAVGTNVASGSTSDSFDHFSPSCIAPANAPDRVQRWTAPQTGTYQFNTANSDFDTVLYVYRNQVEIGCNDNRNSLTTTSTVTLAVTAGDELSIVIDGKNLTGGNYKLNIVKMN